MGSESPPAASPPGLSASKRSSRRWPTAPRPPTQARRRSRESTPQTTRSPRPGTAAPSYRPWLLGPSARCEEVDLLELQVNGVSRPIASPPLTSLLEVLREELAVHSPKVGCE